MKTEDNLIPYLEDIYFAIRPRTVLMVGNPSAAVVDYFYKKSIPIQVYGTQNVKDIQPAQNFEIAIINEHVLSQEGAGQAECLEVICHSSTHVVINTSMMDALEVFNQIGQISRLLAVQGFYRDLDVQEISSPLMVYHKQDDMSGVVDKYEEALQLLRIEDRRRTNLIVEYEDRVAEQSVNHQLQMNTIIADNEAIKQKMQAVASDNEEIRQKMQAVASDNVVLKQKTQTLLQIGQESQRGLQEIREQNEALKQQNEQLDYSIRAFWASRTGKVIKLVERLRQRMIPAKSKREEVYAGLFSGLGNAVKGKSKATPEQKQQVATEVDNTDRQPPQPQGKLCQIGPVEMPSMVKVHQEQVSIIICVHNAYEDVKRCLESVGYYTHEPYEIVIVDDGSAEETSNYLVEYAKVQSVKLVRNETARGYTYAANQGIQASTGEFVVLLNSDTVVTDGWLDRMVACVQASERVGVVGPLANTASYQSIPEYQSNGDWAENALPENITIQDMGRMVAQNSARLYPEMPLLNGFCLLVRRKVFEEIGNFDEENFGAGYGEEDDFVLRARAAGWKLRLADDTYIYHAQSKSYSKEKRIALSERAGKVLKSKHGVEIIQKSVDFMEHNRVLEGIRAKSQVMYEREAAIREGKSEFMGKKSYLSCQ